MDGDGRIPYGGSLGCLPVRVRLGICVAYHPHRFEIYRSMQLLLPLPVAIKPVSASLCLLSCIIAVLATMTATMTATMMETMIAG